MASFSSTSQTPKRSTFLKSTFGLVKKIKHYLDWFKKNKSKEPGKALPPRHDSLAACADLSFATPQPPPFFTGEIHPH
jgi:hypothetical protein